MANITFKQLTKADVEDPITNLSLQVFHQDFFIFLGDANSGKATALRCLQGVIEPDRGQIFIDERDVTTLAPKERHIRTVAGFPLFPNKSVYNNLAFAFTGRSISEAEIKSQVIALAQKLGIETVLKQYPAELTVAQRRKVTIGRLILRKPVAFLFDVDGPIELMQARTSLDKAVENLIDWHRMSELTFISSTENSKYAIMLATRIAVLKDGVLQQVGTPQELINNPANNFVAELLQ